MYVKGTIKECYAYLRDEEVTVVGQKLGSSYIQCEMKNGEVLLLHEDYLCDEPFDPLNPFKSNLYIKS